MARDHARMRCSMWTEDDDWRSLTVPEQATYQMLAQDPQLSYCGVMPYAPAVLAERSQGNTEARVKAAVRGLEAKRFVITDDRTHEILVRTYVRWDNVLARLNMGKAVAAALGRVVSIPLRDAVCIELARLYGEQPNLAGWNGIAIARPALWDLVLGMRGETP